MLEPTVRRQSSQALHPPRESLPRDVLKITVERKSVRNVEVWKRAGNFLQSKVAAFRYIERARKHLGRVLEHPQHFVAVLHVELRALELHPVGFLDGLPRLNAQHHILCVRVVFAKVVAVVGRHQRQPNILLQLEQAGMDAVLHLQTLVLNLQEEILFAKKIAVETGRRARRLVVPFR